MNSIQVVPCMEARPRQQQFLVADLLLTRPCVHAIDHSRGRQRLLA